MSSLKDQEKKTEISKDRESLSSNQQENELSIFTKRRSLDETNFEKHETLYVFKKIDFVWPGAIERLKVADTRKKSNYLMKIKSFYSFI